jgi:ribosome-associated heat shock protein Hsp15
MDGTRIDKWLWAARFFKTRELASKACEMGRIESNGLRAKPAREVRVGDTLQIKNAAAEFEIEVLALSHQRGSAAIAQTLYRESPESVELRRTDAEARRLLAPIAAIRPAHKTRSPPDSQLQRQALKREFFAA